MNQLSIASKRRKSIDLLIQSPRLNFPHSTIETDTVHAFDLVSRKLKRFMSFNKCAEKVDTDKLKIVSDEENQSLSLRLIKCFLFDFGSSSIDLRYEISLAKLMKASNSILNQVD
jgi:hypothetical protein